MVACIIICIYKQEKPMHKRQLFMWLAAASGYIGLGMVLAYTMTDKTTNTPAWIGGVLVLLGSVLLGMFISSQSEKRHSTTTDRPVEDKPKEDRDQPLPTS
jgi:peptidoglycan/LPS O-acetylase OafA/YrhL